MKKTAFTLILSAAVSMMLAVTALCYPVPDMEGAKLVLEENQIVAGKGPKTDIMIRTYTKPDGSRFRVYSVDGHIFRYDIDEDGLMPYEYRLLDEDGDGVFETREMMVGKDRNSGEEYYIDLGSEPGKEYKYWYQHNEEFKDRSLSDQRTVQRELEGFSIYIPAWVLVRFD